MTVYVDNSKIWYRRMRMCHMLADTTGELLEMADTIGVARRWIQDAGTSREHFDICMAKRALAVAAGAREIGVKDLGRLLRARQATSSPAPSPGSSSGC